MGGEPTPARSLDRPPFWSKICCGCKDPPDVNGVPPDGNKLTRTSMAVFMHRWSIIGIVFSVSQLSGANGSWTGSDDVNCGACGVLMTVRAPAPADPIPTDRFSLSCNNRRDQCPGSICFECACKAYAKARWGLRLPEAQCGNGRIPCACVVCHKVTHCPDLVLFRCRDGDGDCTYGRVIDEHRDSLRLVPGFVDPFAATRV